MKILSEIAGAPPSDTLGLHEWLVIFWEYWADRAATPENREYCEDEAWRCARVAEALKRDQIRTAARRALAKQGAA